MDRRIASWCLTFLLCWPATVPGGDDPWWATEVEPTLEQVLDTVVVFDATGCEQNYEEDYWGVHFVSGQGSIKWVVIRVDVAGGVWDFQYNPYGGADGPVIGLLRGLNPSDVQQRDPWWESYPPGTPGGIVFEFPAGAFESGDLMRFSADTDGVNEEDISIQVVMHNASQGYTSAGVILNQPDCYNGLNVRHTVVLTESTTAIRVRPYSRSSAEEPAVINIKNDLGVWVAMWGRDRVDVTQVNPETIRFGPWGARPKNLRVQDLDRDGRLDYVMRFDIAEAGVACGQSDLCIYGAAFNGVKIHDCDAYIDVVPCGP